jgi:hypothetical protein
MIQQININNALSQIPEENLIPMMTMSEKNVDIVFVLLDDPINKF